MSSIGRRTTMEYTAKTGNYFPSRGQVARGATPQFALQNSGCVGAFDTTSLTFSAASLPSGLTTLTANGFLNNVNTLSTGAYDVAQAHFSTHAYTTPSGIICGHISFQLGSGNTTFSATNAVPKSTNILGLYVQGKMVVYAPTAIATAVSITVPVTVLFLGDVRDA